MCIRDRSSFICFASADLLATAVPSSSLASSSWSSLKISCCCSSVVNAFVGSSSSDIHFFSSKSSDKVYKSDQKILHFDYCIYICDNNNININKINRFIGWNNFLFWFSFQTKKKPLEFTSLTLASFCSWSKYSTKSDTNSQF